MSAPAVRMRKRSTGLVSTPGRAPALVQATSPTSSRLTPLQVHMEQHDSATRLAELMYNRRPLGGLSTSSSNSVGGSSANDQPALSSRTFAQDPANPALGLQGHQQGPLANGLHGPQHAGKKLKRDESPTAMQSQTESIESVLQRQR